jgi:predicted membrane chloride channel (bestrophin family)
MYRVSPTEFMMRALSILLVFISKAYGNVNAPTSSVLPLIISPNNSQLQLESSLQQFHKDIQRVRDLPISSLTTPCWEVSRDSTFTKSWGYEDWERHQAHSLIRYAKHLTSILVSTTAHNIAPTIAFVASWTIVLFKVTGKFSLNMSATKFALTLTFIQAPILLLLTLKTNRALDRMLETRKAWGVLSKATRTLAGLIGIHVLALNPKVALLMVRYIAFLGWSLKASFRKNDDDTDMIRALFQEFPEERDWLISSPSRRPIAIITRLRSLQSILVKDSSQGGVSLPPAILLRMEEVLYDIESSVGICVRVFVSPVPPTYTRHTSRVLGKFSSSPYY